MDTPTAGFSAGTTEQNESETTSDRSVVIHEFATEIARQFNLQLESAADAVSLVGELPEPAVLVQRVLKQGAGVESSHDYAVSDSTLVDTVGPSWSIGKLREELGGRSYQAVHQRVGRGTLLALPTSDGATVYPIFQFIRRNGMLKVKPGLIKMFKILQGQDPWQIAVSLNTPAPELGGLSPVAWEQEQGDTEALERLAEAFVREWERS